MNRLTTATAVCGALLLVAVTSRPAVANGSATPPRIKTFRLPPGGNPWGLAIDRSGNVWFVEPRCDVSPSCSPRRRPGRIGELNPRTRRVTLYDLPNIRGNQPVFLAFDNAGRLWFTTPLNSRIGEFDPRTRRFVGQWPVTRGSGPWDLTFAHGQLWYTDHWAAALSTFDISRHSHHDFGTPSANSNPYGLAAGDGVIWFTEDNPSVDRVAALTVASGTITEYPIVLPVSGSPHMLSIAPDGNPWWTEGFSNTIATLDPAAATPGECGVAAGVCNGVRRFLLPSSGACGTVSHVSAIAVARSTGLVWLDDSLNAQVGDFDPTDDAFHLTTLSNCLAHPHDGLALSRGGDVWFDEEFGNAIGELIP